VQKKQSLTEKAISAASFTKASPSGKAADPIERPKSAPGVMFGFMAQQKEAAKEVSAALEENNRLRKELDIWSDALATKKIGCKFVIKSKWANRHDESFKGQEFEQLKSEIESAGGNTQPIKVRPVVGSNPQTYEIVFGHRRHAACAELGLEVLATIEHLDDTQLFEQMDRENRNREDLRPFEQGEMYRRALDEGLYKTMQALAESIGCDQGNISKAINIARLPGSVLSAFQSPLDIQYAWGSGIRKSMKVNNELVLLNAAKINDEKGRGVVISSVDAYRRLTSSEEVTSGKREVKNGDRTIMFVSTKKNKVLLELDAVPGDKLKEIEKMIVSILS
jgi:ParB family chromosome partitioning protein